MESRSSLRIMHTADNHIGLQFSSRGYPAELQRELVEERFEALTRLVGEANRRHAHMLVIAGDLFDHRHVAVKDIQRTAEILSGFSGAHVVVLPGNHDFYEPGSTALWARFTEAMRGGHCVLLHEPSPVRLTIEEHDVVVYPGPCTSKTSHDNAIGWIAAAEKAPAAITLGIAHGSVVGISPDNDGKYYQMTPAELESAGLDCWLLGHTHLRYPAGTDTAGSAFFIPATHTPDGFDCAHEGYAWYLEIDQEKRVTGTSVRTGGYRFLDWSRTVHGPRDIEQLVADLGRHEPRTTLIRLTLEGRLSGGERKALQDALAGLAARFRYLNVDDDGIALNIDRAYIDKHFAQGSLPFLLLHALHAQPGGELALQLAHDLIREARQ